MFKNFFQKQSPVIKIIVIAWIIFSFIYIIYDICGYISNELIKKFYLRGMAQVSADLIQRAEDKECSPFTVNLGQKQVQLINVTCLKTVNSKQ